MLAAAPHHCSLSYMKPVLLNATTTSTIQHKNITPSKIQESSHVVSKELVYASAASHTKISHHQHNISSNPWCTVAAVSTLRITHISSQVVQDPFQIIRSRYTRYDIVIEDPKRAGRKWKITRRFSAFEAFRERLLDVLGVPHCAYCTQLLSIIRALPFPSRKLFGHLDSDVIASRARIFESFLSQLMSMTGLPITKMCSGVASKVCKLIHIFCTHRAVAFSSLEYSNSDSNTGNDHHNVSCWLEQLSTSARHSNSLATIFEEK